MRAIFQFLLVIIFLGITAAFAALNDGLVSINYFIGEGEIRLAYLLLACVAFGGLTGLLLILGSYLKLKMDIRKLKNTVNLNKKELANLRELPVKDPY